ncbi:hypothetical protein MRX96_040807 [Rhipicephalus microplus]
MGGANGNTGRETPVGEEEKVGRSKREARGPRASLKVALSSTAYCGASRRWCKRYGLSRERAEGKQIWRRSRK